MESGELVFPVLDPHEENYTFLWPDTSTGEMRKLGQLSSSQQIEKLYGMQGNSVYYQVREGIIQWDVQSGKRSLVFNFQENGVPMGYKTMYLPFLEYTVKSMIPLKTGWSFFLTKRWREKML